MADVDAPVDTVPGLVSVVLPTYNRARTLARAIRSILTQSYPHFELIVVDDGSKDNTVEVMAEFSDPRVIYHRLDRNQGAAAARNAGMRLARGEFIAFQDSDDEFLSDKLEAQVGAAREAGSDRAVVFHIKLVWGHDEFLVYGDGRTCCVPRIPLERKGIRLDFNWPNRGRVPMLTRKEEGRDFLALMHKDNLISTQTLMFSRTLLAEVGWFDPLLRNSVDWDFALRLVAAGEVIFVEKPLVVAYVQSDSIHTFKRPAARSQLRIVLKLRRQGDIDPAVLSAHLARLGTTLGRFGKPKLARRLLYHALVLNPTKWKVWARWGLNFLQRS